MSRETITIPRPHVPFGPTHVSEDVADADYLRSAARGVEFHGLFGSNLTRVVAQLLRDAADAIAALSSDAAPQVVGVTREAVWTWASDTMERFQDAADDDAMHDRVSDGIFRALAALGIPVTDAPAAPEGERP